MAIEHDSATSQVHERGHLAAEGTDLMRRGRQSPVGGIGRRKGNVGKETFLIRVGWSAPVARAGSDSRPKEADRAGIRTSAEGRFTRARRKQGKNGDVLSDRRWLM